MILASELRKRAALLRQAETEMQMSYEVVRGLPALLDDAADRAEMTISAKRLGEAYAELDREDIAQGLSPGVIPYGVIARIFGKIGIEVTGRDIAVPVEAVSATAGFDPNFDWEAFTKLRKDSP